MFIWGIYREGRTLWNAPGDLWSWGSVTGGGGGVWCVLGAITGEHEGVWGIIRILGKLGRRDRLGGVTGEGGSGWGV